MCLLRMLRVSAVQSGQTRMWVYTSSASLWRPGFPSAGKDICHGRMNSQRGSLGHLRWLLICCEILSQEVSVRPLTIAAALPLSAGQNWV